MLVDHGFIDERWWDFFSNSNRVGFHGISQDALFRYLLNKDTVEKIKLQPNVKTMCSTNCVKILSYLRDFKKECHITNIEVYHSNVNWLPNLLRFHHALIVFKTTNKTGGCYWWSLNQIPENSVTQRSRNEN
jgi:hypothetical protein